MAPYYPLLTLLSVVFFAWLGRHLAIKRNRSGLLWGVGAALLPPVLLVLVLLKPLEADDEDEDEAAAAM